MYFGDNWQEYKKQSIVLNRHSLPLSLSLHQLYVDIFHAAQSIYQKSSFITRYQNPINIKWIYYLNLDNTGTFLPL